MIIINYVIISIISGFLPIFVIGVGTNFVIPSTCGLQQFFDSSTMMCESCLDDQIAANNSLSCVCRPDYRVISNVFETQICGKCIAPSDVITQAQLCIRCPTGIPLNTEGNCNCGEGSIQIETKRSGEPLVERECVRCAIGYVPSTNQEKCVSCTSPYLSIELMARCIKLWSNECPPTLGKEQRPFCLQLDPDFQAESGPLTTVSVGAANNFVESLYYRDHLRLTISQSLCLKGGRSFSCSQLKNLCSLRGSSGNLERSDSVCIPATGQSNAEEMIISDAEVNTKLPPISFVTDRAREMYASGKIYSYVDLRAAKFNLNGSFEGWIDASDGFLQFCKNERFPDAWLGFGVNYVMKCQISTSELWQKYDTKYYQLYIVYPENDEQTGSQEVKKYIVPVRMTSPSGQQANKWLARFFMVDKDSLRNKESESVNDVLRFAEKISLRIRVNGSDAILPPQLLITYKDIFSGNEDGKVDVEFSVTYEGSGTSFSDLLNMLLLILVLVIGYVSIKIYGWFQRRGDCDQGACLFPSIMFIVAGAANCLTIVALVISIWYLVAYKFQKRAVFMLPAEGDGEQNFVIIVIVACVCKFLHCLEIIIQQTMVEIFFLDWEQPKLSQVVSLSSTQEAAGANTSRRSVSAVRTQPQRSAEANKPIVDEVTQPVSVWRTFFVGNEWNELQIIRRTNQTIQLLVVMTLLEYIGLGNIATGDPFIDLDLSNDYYHSEFRKVLRFGISSIVYILFALAQWLFFLFIYERWVADAARNFVDLCAVSNISVFVLSEQRHGYYIHGRLLHGHADTNQRELAEFLESEAKDESPQGGLFKTAQRTYEVMVPPGIRVVIDSYVTKMKNSSRLRERNARGNVSHESNDYQNLAAVQEYLKMIISKEGEQSSEGTGTVVRTRKGFVENMFDIECIRSVDGMVFYEDDGRSFENILLLGHEFSLSLFEMLLFCLIDMFTNNATLAGLVTFVVSQLLITLRANLGEKNVALKTGVDERFLI